MITTGTMAGAMAVGDIYFEFGHGRFQIDSVNCGVVAGQSVVLFEVTPLGKNQSMGGKVWKPMTTILQKVTG